MPWAGNQAGQGSVEGIRAPATGGLTRKEQDQGLQTRRILPYAWTVRHRGGARPRTRDDEAIVQTSVHVSSGYCSDAQCRLTGLFGKTPGLSIHWPREG